MAVDFLIYARADNRAYGHVELRSDADLRRRIDLAGDPIGGLSLSCDGREVTLDDTIHFIAHAFLYDAPAALRAGQSFGYRLRLSPGQLGISNDAGVATVIDDNSDQLVVPTEDLLQALDAARVAYEALMETTRADIEASVLDLFCGIDADTGKLIVMIGDASYADLPAVLAAAPALLEPANAGRFAQVLVHFAQGTEFAVIEDPAAFEAAYRARLATEDPAAPWRPGVYRLSDFGVPDFGQIHAPRCDGQTVVFFARDRLLGVPYRIVGQRTGEPLADSDFRPMPLSAPPRG